MSKRFCIFVISSIFALLLYGEEISLDSLLEQLDSTFYQRESKSSKNFESTGEIKYGNFYIKGGKSKNKDIFGFGVEKNLKDLIYSKYDSDLKNLFYEENKDRVQYLKKLQLEKISLINLYKDIKDVESEIIIKSNALKVLRAQKNVLDNSYKLGKVSKIDLESVKYEIQNNISDYNKEILVLKNRQYLEEKIYNIKLLENKHGKTKYIDVIEAFDKYIKTSVNLEKEINKLNAYLYVVKVRGEEL